MVSRISPQQQQQHQQQQQPLVMSQPEVRLWPKSTTNFDLLRLLSAVTCRPWPQFYQKVDLNTAFCVSDYRVHDCPIVYVSSSFETLTGYSERECLGYNCRFLQGAETNPMTVRAIRRCIDQMNEGRFKLKNYRKDGQPFMNYLSIIPIFTGPLHDLIYYLGVQSNVPWDNEEFSSPEEDNASENNRVPKSFLSIGQTRSPGAGSTCTGFTGALSGGMHIHRPLASEKRGARRLLSDGGYMSEQALSLSSDHEKDDTGVWPDLQSRDKVKSTLALPKMSEDQEQSSKTRTKHTAGSSNLVKDAPIELVGKDEEKTRLSGAFGNMGQDSVHEGANSGNRLPVFKNDQVDIMKRGADQLVGNNDETSSHISGTNKRPKMYRYESHSVIEKRRRDRINQSLTQLAELIPECREYTNRVRKKLDKAEVLEMAVEHVKNMDQKVLGLNRQLAQPQPRVVGQVLAPAPPSAATASGEAPVATWDLPKVCVWLEKLLLKQYTDAFVENAVDGPLLVSLTPEELEFDLKITNRLHRKKIMMSLQKLKLGYTGSDVPMASDGGSVGAGGSAAGEIESEGAQGLLNLASSVGRSVAVTSAQTNPEAGTNTVGDIKSDVPPQQDVSATIQSATSVPLARKESEEASEAPALISDKEACLPAFPEPSSTTAESKAHSTTTSAAKTPTATLPSASVLDVKPGGAGSRMTTTQEAGKTEESCSLTETGPPPLLDIE